jgi:HAE1 family hydrophobic/amphiphilic exporter-1
MEARRQVMGLVMKDPNLVRVRPNGLDDLPEYRTDVDWEKAGPLEVPITTVHDTISAAFGRSWSEIIAPPRCRD